MNQKKTSLNLEQILYSLNNPVHIWGQQIPDNDYLFRKCHAVLTCLHRGFIELDDDLYCAEFDVNFKEHELK